MLRPMSTPPLAQIACRYAGCQNLFSPGKFWQKFCSRQCRQRYHDARTKTARDQYKKDNEQFGEDR